MKKIILISALTLLIAAQGICQQTDTRLWKGISLQKKLTKDLSIEFKDQIRLKNNLSTFQSNIFDTNLSYKLFDNWLRPSIGYRFTLRDKGQSHRVYTDLKSRYKIENTNLSLGLRLRYQSNFNKNDFNDQAIRPKFTTSYRIKAIDLDLSAYGEIFYSFSRFEKEFDQYRLGLGAAYDITKRNQVKFTYFYRKDFNITNPLTAHVFVLGLGIDISKKKKDKENSK